MPGPTVSPAPPPVINVPSSVSSSRPFETRPADLGGAWKYSDAIAVGIGGECVRFMFAGFGRQPAALNPAVFKKASLIVIRRSPTPSDIVSR
jgi:uncharacterized protein with LGFP repeats